ncbi:MAG: helix-turn-helix transcriptional regulator [Devosia sp.]
MAYEKARDLLELAMALAASHFGLSATEIESRLAERGGSQQSGAAVERQRQRMLAQLGELFGTGLDMFTDDDGHRRWTLRSKDLLTLPHLDPADLAALDRATEMMARRGDRDGAERLTRLHGVLNTAMDARRRARFEVDFEALRDSQTIVAQPGPQIEIDATIERAVSEAILKGRCLDFHYPSNGTLVRRSVEPAGVLLGPRKYLVARASTSPDGSDASHWRMDRISEPVVSDKPARAMPEGFTLADHARRCFGVFWNKDEYLDVEWRFAPRAANSVSSWRFHPDQTLEHNDDGSVTVRFRASGHYEMAWHLYQWGDAVEVIAPKAVADLVKGHQRKDFRALP